MLSRVQFFTVSLASIAMLLCLTHAGSTGASAQEAGEFTECEQMLRSPPYVDVLTRNEGKDFHELSSLKSGVVFVGLECSVDELTAIFEDAR